MLRPLCNFDFSHVPPLPATCYKIFSPWLKSQWRPPLFRIRAVSAEESLTTTNSRTGKPSLSLANCLKSSQSRVEFDLVKHPHGVCTSKHGGELDPQTVIFNSLRIEYGVTYPSDRQIIELGLFCLWIYPTSKHERDMIRYQGQLKLAKTRRQWLPEAHHLTPSIMSKHSLVGTLELERTPISLSLLAEKNNHFMDSLSQVSTVQGLAVVRLRSPLREWYIQVEHQKIERLSEQFGDLLEICLLTGFNTSICRVDVSISTRID